MTAAKKIEYDGSLLDKQRRVLRGRREPAFFLRYYLHHAFPVPFGRYHIDIIEEFQSLIEETAKRRPKLEVVPDWREVDTTADDGDEDEYSEEEWKKIIEEVAATEAAFAASYACPREHGKSTLLAGLVLWAICYKLRRYVCFVSDTISQAAERLGEIVGEMEMNELLRADFGDLVGPKRWTQTDVITKTGVRVRAYGARSKVRGAKHGAFRPDLAVVDDLENDKAVGTDEQRAWLREWFTKALLPAIDSDVGVVFMVGTIIHHDSLLARTLSQKHFGRWRKSTYKALNRKADCPSCGLTRLLRYDHRDEDVITCGGCGHEWSQETKLRALWPRRWPVRKLLLWKHDKGTVAFQSEMQNEPVSDETSPFRLAWLESCLSPHGWSFAESYEDIKAILGGDPPLVYVMGCDFGWVDDKAKAVESDSNFTVYIVIAVHPKTRHRYIVRIFRDRGLAPSEIRAMIVREYGMARPDAAECSLESLAVESVGLQKQLYVMEMQQQTDLPIRGVHTDSGKHDPFTGVPMLAQLFENGQIVLPWPSADQIDPDRHADTAAEADRQRELSQALINELWGLGKEPHNDMVMALWFAELQVKTMLRVHDRGARGGASDDKRRTGKPIGGRRIGGGRPIGA